MSVSRAFVPFFRFIDLLRANHEGRNRIHQEIHRQLVFYLDGDILIHRRGQPNLGKCEVLNQLLLEFFQHQTHTFASIVPCYFDQRAYDDRQLYQLAGVYDSAVELMRFRYGQPVDNWLLHLPFDCQFDSFAWPYTHLKRIVQFTNSGVDERFRAIMYTHYYYDNLAHISSMGSAVMDASFSVPDRSTI